MKTFIVFFFLLIFFSTAYAQDKEVFSESYEKKRYSKTEEFLNMPGVLRKREFVDIGSVKKIQIQGLKVTDLTTGEIKKAIFITVKGVRTNYIAPRFSNIIDPEEIPLFLKSIETVTAELDKKSDLYTEINYQSIDGLRFGCYRDKKSSTTIVYLQSDKYFSDSLESFLATDRNLSNLQKYINEAANYVAAKE